MKKRKIGLNFNRSPTITPIIGDGLFEFYTILPIHLTAVAHSRLHWTRIKKIYDSQALLVNSGLKAQMFDFKPPAKITLTRIAPRELDYDNLVTAFKHIRDIVADTLIPGLAKGRADGDPRLTWSYTQHKGKPKEYAIRIDIST